MRQLLNARPGEGMRLPVLRGKTTGGEAEEETEQAGEYCQVREVDMLPAVGPDTLVARYLVFRPYAFSLNIHPATPEPSRYSFRMLNCEAKLVRWTLLDNGLSEVRSGDQWTIMWASGSLRSSVFQTLGKFQKVNHFPRSIEISRKDCLYKNLARMQALHSSKNYSFFPQTFLLPQEASELVQAMESDPSAIWILKPSGSSQGKGIFLTQDPGDIPFGHSMVACRYIDNPYLINGYKFDLRVYVAVTSYNPLRVYVYREGLARFATVPYRSSDLSNRFMHLTNYSVNKHNPAFKASAQGDSGSKWSISALSAYFHSHNLDFSPIWHRIKEIVVKTIISIESTVSAGVEMYVSSSNSCFELLGFDILLDDLLTPWLLEVNLSPSLNCDTALDLQIKSQLIADLLNLVGIIGNREAGPRAKTKSESRRPWDTSTHAFSTEWLGDDCYSKQERAILRAAEEEMKRVNGFERVFPGDGLTYRSLFAQERPLNTLLQNHCLGVRRGATRQAAWTDNNQGLLPRPKKPKARKIIKSTPETYVEMALLKLRRELGPSKAKIP